MLVIVQHSMLLIYFSWILDPRYISGGVILTFFYLPASTSNIFNVLFAFVDIDRMFSTYIKMYYWYWGTYGLVAVLRNTSGSATHELKPISSNFFAANDRKAALDNLNPYKSLITMNNFPCSTPNSDPAIIQCFSKLDVDRK